MKYFIYCRKSSEENNKQVQSLGTQQRILVDLALKLELEVVDIIKESKSAKTDQNRPLFTKMLERIQNGEANGILVVHTDRLARNFIDAGFIIKLIESQVIKEVRTPTSVFNNVPSLMYMGFDFVFASHYSRDLSVKVKAGNESKLLKGEYPGTAPIGYVNIRPGKGIEPDPIRSPFVKKAFKLFASREFSLKSLSQLLYKQGLRSRFGNKIHVSSLYLMLTNPAYYGAMKRKGILYAGTHQPLITKEIFDQVQEVLTNKTKPKKSDHKFTYRDFLVCNKCGCKVTAGVAKGKYTYYRCTNAKGICNQNKKYWNNNHVYQQFKEFFSGFTLDPEKANRAFDLYKAKVGLDSNLAKNKNKAIKQQVKDLENKISKLEDMYLEDRISAEKFDQKKKDFNAELTQLKLLSRQKNQAQDNYTLELVEELKNKAIQLDFIFEDGDDEVRRDLLTSVLWNSNFEDGKITSTRLTKLWKPLENFNNLPSDEVRRKVQDLNLWTPYGE